MELKDSDVTENSNISVYSIFLLDNPMNSLVIKRQSGFLLVFRLGVFSAVCWNHYG